MREALVLVTLAGVACSSSTAARVYGGPDTPQLQLTLSTDPPALADGVALDARIRLTFDDYPDPDSIGFGPVLLRSGRGNLDADLRVDLVGRAVVVRPHALLQAGTTYEVLVDKTVSALDGRQVGRTVSFSFVTGAGKGNLPPPPPVAWADVARVLSTCEAGCHGRFDSERQLRLDYALAGGATCDPAADLAIDRDAGADLAGFQAADPGDPTFGIIEVPALGLAGTQYPLKRVARGDGARSDLLRKLIGGNHQESSTDPPYPQMKVDGRRMPTGGAPLCNDQIQLIQDWIDEGAPVR